MPGHLSSTVSRACPSLTISALQSSTDSHLAAPAASAAGPWRPVHAALALGCLAVGLALAGQHPLAPVAAPLLFLGAVLASLRWPQAWLVALPAALPVLSLAPWTGWVALAEFDLAVLAVLAAGHARLAWTGRLPRPAQQAAAWRRADLLCAALWAWLALGLELAWGDAGTPPPGPPEASAAFANSLRVAKSFAFVLLAVPLLRDALLRAPGVATVRLGLGVLAGLALGVAGVLWERAAFPGLLDFAEPYRTAGLFWEMHKGGATIDAFLALSVPFVAWALATARRPLHWLAAAALALLVAYVCLTTFARGVFGSVLGGLLVAAALSWLRRGAMPASGLPPWRARAARWLTLLLAWQVLAMVLASSFLEDRMSEADQDFGHRWNHWTRGVGLLHTPADWLLGLGLGRLPARYVDPARTAGTVEGPAPREEFAGAAEWHAEADASADGNGHERFVRLWGPASRMVLGGRYMLTQQIDPVPGARYRVALDVRAARPVLLQLRVCERHLLYSADCQLFNLPIGGRRGSSWRHLELGLRGAALEGGPRWAPRLVSFSMAAVLPGSTVDVAALRLTAGNGGNLLSNGDFKDGLARWYPVLRGYFVPWHIDNLYLESLIEGGLAGLLLLGLLLGVALWRVSFGAARTVPAAPYLAAALAAACALGLVSSILDMARPAWLMLLLAFWCLHLPPATQAVEGDSYANPSDL